MNKKTARRTNKLPPGPWLGTSAGPAAVAAAIERAQVALYMTQDAFERLVKQEQPAIKKPKGGHR